jgi:hypothetical protein
MEKLNSFAASPGADFYGAFEAADPSNSSIDSEIAKHLNNNPDGIEFSYGGKDYVLAKDQTTNKYTLHLQTPSGSVLKDENVQIGTKFAPAGFVEIGGLSKAGTRLFIGRSPENAEQVIAFEGAHDTSSVSFKPENAVVLYDGSKKPTAEGPAQPDGGGGGATVPLEPETGGGATVPLDPEPETGGGATVPIDSDAPASDGGDSATGAIDESTLAPIVPADYVYPRSLPNGQYEVTGDGAWINSAGDGAGQSMAVAGTYEVKNGKLFRFLNTGNGDPVLVPANDYSGGYMMGSSFKTPDGKMQEASFEFLRQNGVESYDIAMEYIDISDDTSGQFSKIEIDGLMLIADADGKVLGMAHA